MVEVFRQKMKFPCLPEDVGAVAAAVLLMVDANVAPAMSPAPTSTSRREIFSGDGIIRIAGDCITGIKRIDRFSGEVLHLRLRSSGTQLQIFGVVFAAGRFG